MLSTELSLVLLLTVMFGAFGGIVGALQWVDVSRLITGTHQAKFTLVRCGATAWGLFVGGMCGVGGALASVLILHIGGKIPEDLKTLSDGHLLTICTVSSIGGFAGIRLMKHLAQRLEQTLHAAEKAAEHTAERITNEKLVQTHLDLKIFDAVNRGFEAVRSDAMTSSEDDAIEQLEHCRTLVPDHRRVAIVLGRIYAKRGKYDKAVEVITDTLAAMTRLRSERPKDMADLLYNRACYYSHMANLAPADKRSALQDRALRDLTESVRLSPENKKEAREDVDFASLRENADFQKITNP